MIIPIITKKVVMITTMATNFGLILINFIAKLIKTNKNEQKYLSYKCSSKLIQLLNNLFF
ncbi:MAG: hypothetical protein ACI914_001017 [Candidatus Marivariicella framensis]|jgi:hypothetical protein